MDRRQMSHSGQTATSVKVRRGLFGVAQRASVLTKGSKQCHCPGPLLQPTRASFAQQTEVHSYSESIEKSV